MFSIGKSIFSYLKKYAIHGTSAALYTENNKSLESVTRGSLFLFSASLTDNQHSIMPRSSIVFKFFHRQSLDDDNKNRRHRNTLQQTWTSRYILELYLVKEHQYRPS